jgi:hypothetical protein
MAPNCVREKVVARDNDPSSLADDRGEFSFQTQFEPQILADRPPDLRADAVVVTDYGF